MNLSNSFLAEDDPRRQRIGAFQFRGIIREMEGGNPLPPQRPGEDLRFMLPAIVGWPQASMKNLLPTLWRLLNGFALSIFFGFALGAGNYYAHAEEDGNALEAAWDKVLLLQHREAYRDFSMAGASLDGHAREAKFAQAVILLSLQPRTRSNIRSAEKLFRDLAHSEPNDRLGLWAQYYLARIPHIPRF